MSSLPPTEGIAPLQKLLAAHGVPTAPWALVEACGGDVSLSSFARCARQHGLETQLFDLKAGDCSHLRTGALVELEDGAILTVVALTRRGAVLEGVGGLRSNERQASPGHGAVRALDVRLPSANDDLLTRLSSRLRAEPHAVRAIVLASVLALVLLAATLAGPMLSRAVIGHAIPNRASSELGVLALAAALLGVSTTYVGWLRRRTLLYLSSTLSEASSTDTVGHLLRLPYARLRSLDVASAELAVRSATSAAEALPSLVPQLVDAVLGFGLLFYVFLLDPVSAMIATVGGGVTILLGLLNAKRRLASRRELLQVTRKEEQGLYETFIGVETIKSESAEGRMLARWLDRVLVEQEVALDLRIRGTTFTTVLSGIDRLVFGAVLLATAQRCIATGAPVADLVATLQAAMAFLGSAQKLAQLPLSIANFRSDLERANELLTEPAEPFSLTRKPADTRAPAILLREAWFRYDADAPWVLREMNLVIRQGEAVMLSWPSGAGKSTLLRLIAGLLPPTRGDALLYGIEATQARRMVSYIPQQATLFPGSLMENLRILSGGVGPERILEAARDTGLLDLAAQWPMGLDTVLSVGGANVSSGQKQLVLFTAAVASDKPVVLLDEALAHVDLGLRARLGGAGLFTGRTVVSVVHDASARETAEVRLVELLGTR